MQSLYHIKLGGQIDFFFFPNLSLVYLQWGLGYSMGRLSHLVDQRGCLMIFGFFDEFLTIFALISVLLKVGFNNKWLGWMMLAFCSGLYAIMHILFWNPLLFLSVYVFYFIGKSAVIIDYILKQMLFLRGLNAQMHKNAFVHCQVMVLAAYRRFK